MSRIYKPVPIAAAIAIVLVLTAVGFVIVNPDESDEFDVNSVLPPPISQPAKSNKIVTIEELAKSDGKDGRACFVAVEATVYEVAQGRLWNNGQHDTSNGQAMCGRDLTQAIAQSPHGKAKLKDMQIIGTYKP